MARCVGFKGEAGEILTESQVPQDCSVTDEQACWGGGCSMGTLPERDLERWMAASKQAVGKDRHFELGCDVV